MGSLVVSCADTLSQSPFVMSLVLCTYKPSPVSSTTLFRTIGADAAARLRPQDEPLISALEGVGFRTVPPEDKPNLLVLTTQRAGGFYINIGGV